MLYENTADHQRMWPWLSGPDGTTVELDAGEQVELDEEVDDPWLKPAKSAKAPPPAPPAPPVEPAADATKE